VVAVRAALTDRDRPVREAAVLALASIRTPEAVSALIGGMQLEDRELKAAIASGLKSFEWTPTDASERIVHAALHGRFDEAEAEGAAAVEPLIAALADRDPSARRGALAALGRLGDARAASAIAALFKDADASVRDASADALASIGPASADALLEALRDRATTVRTAAERALSGVGEGRVAAALVGRLTSGQPTRHGGTNLRVVATRAQLDATRQAADALDTLLRRMLGRMPVEALRQVVALTDVILLEPGTVPGHSDTIDTEELRQTAKDELTRRGL
jgi:HEAT repeat protein